MATSNLNIRIDSELRSQATAVLESYGLSPTQAIKLFFGQVVATRKVPLSFDYHADELSLETLNTQTLQAIAQGRADYKAGRLQAYASV